MRRSGCGDDHVAGPAVDALALDCPAHAARAHDDDVVLRRVVDVCLLDLAGRVRDEVSLQVLEPDSLVLAVRADEAAVVGCVRDLDHGALPAVG